ncbi:MAG: magnesium transporter, partial [Elusimicrobiota bacterium]
RELRVGFSLGIIYAIMAGAAALTLYGAKFGLIFAVVVALGVASSMTIASVVGAAEPFVFNKLKIDPATAAGPLVTTMTDLVSVTIYLGVASLLLTWRP